MYLVQKCRYKAYLKNGDINPKIIGRHFESPETLCGPKHISFSGDYTSCGLVLDENKYILLSLSNPRKNELKEIIGKVTCKKCLKLLGKLGLLKENYCKETFLS